MAMSIHPQTRIGHVHLTVSDLERALAFYRDVLGFEVTSRYGRDAVFLSAGGYHHHIGLNTWAGRGAPAPAPGTTGLYHFAILYPDRSEEHTSELQSRLHLVCRLLLEKKKKMTTVQIRNLMYTNVSSVTAR